MVLPLTGRHIPIVADAYSDPEKGTGAVKITPAHDFNDFEVGQRHDLAMPQVLDGAARIVLDDIEEQLRAVPGVADPAFVHALAGLPREAARAAIVARDGAARPARSYRGLTRTRFRMRSVVAPWSSRALTTQWYCDAKRLAGPAIAAVQQNRMQFVPRQWENTFFAWMRDIQPWCISRQLWWGHRNPGLVWTRTARCS